MTQTSFNDGANQGGIHFNPPLWMAIAGFTAVAWVTVVELDIKIFLTFKKRRGLYFGSLLASTTGIILHSLGFIFKFFNLTNVWLAVAMSTAGWYTMVTGQSLVLYARLHLIVRDPRILRAVLIMICTDAVLFHIPTTVLSFGSARTPVDDPLTQRFTYGFSIMDRIELCAFSTQEFIISGIYIWSTLKFLRPLYQNRAKHIMRHIIAINIIIVFLDVVVLTVQFLLLYTIQATLKSMVYAIKLKMEFVVLNELRSIVHRGVAGSSGQPRPEEDHKNTFCMQCAQKSQRQENFKIDTRVSATNQGTWPTFSRHGRKGLKRNGTNGSGDCRIYKTTETHITESKECITRLTDTESNISRDQKDLV